MLAAEDWLAIEMAESTELTDDELDHVETILRRYDEVDARLVAAGFPPTSPRWRQAIERWYQSGKRQIVIRAGRRAGKSSTLSRLGVVEALYGQHDVPPGDLGTVAIISTRRDEAAKRLRTITAILDVLGEKYRPLPGGAIGVELVGRRRAFQVFAASIAGVSGFTAIFVLCDEVAKWLDSETGANPATEVLASVRPTMATQRNARIALSSSPMGRLDAHFDAYEQGETELQLCEWFPTWEANPTLTEADTRALEPDESVWLREYKAIPQAEAESSLLSQLLLDQATRHPPQLIDIPPEPGHVYVATMDPATRGNAWTLIVATRGPDMVRRVVLAREWRGSPSMPLSSRSVLAEIAALVRPYGITHVYTDQLAIDPLTELAAMAGLGLIPESWTQQSKREAYEELRTVLLARQFECHPDPQVASDLLGIRKILTRVGVSYELAMHDGRHSDYAPAVAMAVREAILAAPADKPELSVGERAQADKVRFLLNRERERKAAERRGQMPITHRRRAV